jgi:hypothetical protein
VLDAVGVERLVGSVGIAHAEHLERLEVGRAREAKIRETIRLPREARQEL